MDRPRAAPPTDLHRPDRRELLLGTGALGLGLAARLRPRVAGPQDPPTGAARRPDVLVLMVDQQRHDCLGATGRGEATTPAMDAFTAEALRFENAYANVPLCVPARQCFLTGRFASHHGAFRNRLFEVQEERTFAHALRDAGYRTGWFGKTHANVTGFTHLASQEALLEAFRAAHPDAKLPGEVHAKHDQVVEIPFLEPYNLFYEDAGPDPVFHMEEAVTRETLGFLREVAREERAGPRAPFLAVASYLAPHPPLFPPDDFLDLYRDADVPSASDMMRVIPDLPGDYKARRRYQRHVRVRDELMRNVTRAYLAALAWTDLQVGRLLEGLADLGLARDTLVVLCSDHGEMLGEQGMIGKRTFFDGAARIPLALRWPGRLPAGASRREVVSQVDLTATLLDLCGVQMGAPLDGDPFTFLLDPEPVAGATWKDSARLEMAPSRGIPDAAACTQSDRPEPPSGFYWALRRGSFKYMHHAEGERHLFDLESDPGELANRIHDPDLAEVAEACEAELLAHSPRHWGFVSDGDASDSDER